MSFLKAVGVGVVEGALLGRSSEGIGFGSC